jgi:hypothetical protein
MSGHGRCSGLLRAPMNPACGSAIRRWRGGARVMLSPMTKVELHHATPHSTTHDRIWMRRKLVRRHGWQAPRSAPSPKSAGQRRGGELPFRTKENLVRGLSRDGFEEPRAIGWTKSKRPRARGPRPPPRSCRIPDARSCPSALERWVAHFIRFLSRLAWEPGAPVRPERRTGLRTVLFPCRAVLSLRPMTAGAWPSCARRRSSR